MYLVSVFLVPASLEVLEEFFIDEVTRVLIGATWERLLVRQWMPYGRTCVRRILRLGFVPYLSEQYLKE